MKLTLLLALIIGMILKTKLFIIIGKRQLKKRYLVRNVRSVSNNYTVFATETFIDEVAHEIDEDPLAFTTIKYLKGKA